MNRESEGGKERKGKERKEKKKKGCQCIRPHLRIQLIYRSKLEPCINHGRVCRHLAQDHSVALWTRRDPRLDGNGTGKVGMPALRSVGLPADGVAE